MEASLPKLKNVINTNSDGGLQNQLYKTRQRTPHTQRHLKGKVKFLSDDGEQIQNIYQKERIITDPGSSSNLPVLDNLKPPKTAGRLQRKVMRT